MPRCELIFPTICYNFYTGFMCGILHKPAQLKPLKPQNYLHKSEDAALELLPGIMHLDPVKFNPCFQKLISQPTLFAVHTPQKCNEFTPAF